MVLNSVPVVDHKSLEHDVGFLVHLSHTFPAIFPYLRGIYNTLNGWRKGRDQDGWKLTRREWDLLLAMEEEMEGEELEPDPMASRTPSKLLSAAPAEDKAPNTVRPMPHLSRDLSALQRLFCKEYPPNRLVRGQLIHAIKYAFGDTSKAGFGASWVNSGGIKYWGKRHSRWIF